MSDAQTTVVSTPNTGGGNYRLPESSTLLQCAKLAIVEDKPIMLDYWVNSIEKKAIIGVRENKEKLLVKSEDEYTSPINKIFIYLVDVEIPTKRIAS